MDPENLRLVYTMSPRGLVWNSYKDDISIRVFVKGQRLMTLCREPMRDLYRVMAVNGNLWAKLDDSKWIFQNLETKWYYYIGLHCISTQYRWPKPGNQQDLPQVKNEYWLLKTGAEPSLRRLPRRIKGRRRDLSEGLDRIKAAGPWLKLDSL